MEGITEFIVPPIKRELGYGKWVEIRFEKIQDQVVIRPYVMFGTLHKPIVRIAKLSNVPDTVCGKHLWKAKLFFQDAIIQVRNNIDGIRVECLPRVRGGMCFRARNNGRSERIRLIDSSQRSWASEEKREEPDDLQEEKFDVELVKKHLEKLDLQGITRTKAASEVIKIGKKRFQKGDFLSATQFFEASLNISLFLKDFYGEGNACCNLGNAFFLLEKSDKAIEMYDKALNICQELCVKENSSLGAIFHNLGNAWLTRGDCGKAIELYRQAFSVKMRQYGNEHPVLSEVLSNLGAAYSMLGDKKKAIEVYEKALVIRKQFYGEEHISCAISFNNFGVFYKKNHNFPDSEKHFRQAIAIYSKLQSSLDCDNQQWNISIFENQSKSYRQLEGLLIAQGKYTEALSISEHGRSRALVDSLGYKISSKKRQEHKMLSPNEMQELARRFQTHFLVFSSNFSGNGNFHSWVIPPDGEISYHPLDSQFFFTKAFLKGQFTSLHDRCDVQVAIDQKNIIDGWFTKDLEDLALKKDIYQSQRTEEDKHFEHEKKHKMAKQQANQKLKECYTALIAPLEKTIPPNSKITIVPDEALHELPFAAFQDKEGRYLIEKYTISIAPSIEVLNRLAAISQKRENKSSKSVLVVGDAQSDVLYDKEKSRILGNFKCSRIEKDKATVDIVARSAAKASLLHFECNGDRNRKKNRHSVFEGALGLASSKKEIEWWYADQIQKMPLSADLAFLSSCNSGREKIKKEGVIGLIRSFLAAGVSSVVSTYWELPDDVWVTEFARKFYVYFLEHKKNKAEAFREAMLESFKNPEIRKRPELWGAFFLMGLP